MFIRQEKFGGTVPKVAPNLIAPNMARVALDCRLTSGNLRPLRTPEQIWTPTKAGTIKTILKYAGVFWFHWITDVHMVKSPLAADTQERVYWTGDGVPKVSDATIATAGGGTNYPTNSYNMALPSPVVAPSIAAGAGGGCEASELSDRFYVTTFVRTFGGITEESGPSPPTTTLSLCPDQFTSLGAIALPPAGNYNITHVRIYRAIAGDLFRVATLAVGAVPDPYLDQMPMVTAAQQVPLPSLDWLPIPDDAKNLIALAGGGAACISGKSVLFSVPYQFHAWPLAYRYAFQEVPAAIGAFGNSVVVVLPGEKPQLLSSGGDPASMGQDYFELDQTCESARSLVSAGGMVFYAAPDGLCGVGPGVSTNLTEQIVDRDSWRALKPSSILGVVHDGRYYGFYDTGTGSKGAFIFDPKNELAPWQTSSIHATAAWSDPETDSLYLVVSGQIVRWDTGATPLPYTWESRDYILPKRVSMALAKVEAADYDEIHLHVYAGEKKIHQQRVVDAEPFWLPDTDAAGRYRLRLTGTSEVLSAMLAETTEEIEKA